MNQSATPDQDLNPARYDPRRWPAKLTLHYRNNGQKTVIARREHCGPLTVQKPFYPEQDTCHTYLLHPPGGVVGGDELSLEVQVQPQAHALITTPASGKFYRCDDRIARQSQRLVVDDGGILEWMPQESILFDRARVQTHTRVELSGTAHFCGWEMICLGRPASNESYQHGFYRQVLELYRDEERIFLERSRLEGGSDLLSASWGMQQYTVLGLMLITQADSALLDQARQVSLLSNGLAGLSLLDDLLVCRALGQQGIEVREYFSRLWQKIRPLWIQRQAVEPRIWYT